VVVVGATVVEPLAATEVNPLGLILMLVAPLVVQLKVALAPELMLAGLAANEPTVGPPLGLDALTKPAQPVRTHPERSRTITAKNAPALKDEVSRRRAIKSLPE
jgi:hypothetical protein